MGHESESEQDAPRQAETADRLPQRQADREAASDKNDIDRDKNALEREKHLLDLWAKQEDVAMHFNDLAMRLRIQALAGIGASTLIAGSVFSHQGRIEPLYIGIFLIAATIVWAAIWLLDHFYYQNLLLGAVESIVRLERAITALLGRTHAGIEIDPTKTEPKPAAGNKRSTVDASPPPTWPPRLELSEQIRVKTDGRGKHARAAFYLIVGTVLLSGGIVLIARNWNQTSSAPSEPPCVKLCAAPCASASGQTDAGAAVPPPGTTPSPTSPASTTAAPASAALLGPASSGDQPLAPMPTSRPGGVPSAPVRTTTSTRAADSGPPLQ